MSYSPDPARYNSMHYRHCGRSGLKLPIVSLGLWHNFGHVDMLENARKILHLAFDSGSPILTSLTIMAHRRDRQRKISGASCNRIFRATGIR